jgi:hypothetical protein
VHEGKTQKPRATMENYNEVFKNKYARSMPSLYTRSLL